MFILLPASNGPRFLFNRNTLRKVEHQYDKHRIKSFNFVSYFSVSAQYETNLAVKWREVKKSAEPVGTSKSLNCSGAELVAVISRH